jgi:apolipoprotein N-acyltransferase
MSARSRTRDFLSPTRSGRRGRWSARIAALALGGVLSLAFPEPGVWWLGWVGLAPILIVVARSPSRRESIFRGWLAGVGYLTALHYWVIPYTGIFTVLLAAFVGLFWLPLGLVCWWGLRAGTAPRRRIAALVVIPSVWVVIEAVRSWEYFGGTWGLLGLSQWQVETLLQGAALGGVWLLSFVMVAVNVALALVVLGDESTSKRLGHVALALMLPLLLVTYGSTRPESLSSGVVSVGGVQPGVFDDSASRLDAHVEEARALAGDDDVDFVVWGQTSVAYDPFLDENIGERLQAVRDLIGADLFVNIDARSEAGIVRTTVQYTADGPASESYGKRRLVPFGEYIPLRPLFGWVSDFTQAATQDRIRGQGPVVMETAGVTIGPLISYESTFPDMRRELARLDVDLTIVQGGTQTFQGTWAQAQQASYEAVKAVASGRPAVLVAVSGVSAAFDSRGRLLLWYPADRVGTFLVDVPLAKEDTLYVRFGDWVIWLALAVVAVTIAPAMVRRAQTRGYMSR